MSESQPAPPKVGHPDRQRNKGQESDKPWLGWAGLWFGAGWLVVSFSRLVTATTNYQVEPIFNASGGAMILVAFFLACAGLPKSFSKRTGDEDTLPYGAITTLLIMAGSAVTLVAAAVLATEESLETAVENEVEALGWQQHSFSDGKFSVNTPAVWQAVTPQRIVADLYLVDHSADLHLTCAVLPKTDVAAAHPVEVAEMGLAFIKMELENVQAEDPFESSVNGYPAVDRIVQGRIEGVVLRFYIRYVEYGDVWVQLKAWSTPSRCVENQEIFARIFNSIEIHR